MLKSKSTRRQFLAGAAGATVGMVATPAIRRADAQVRVLTVAIPSNPATFDPINQTNHDAMVVNQLIFENLIEIDADGRRIPMLARNLPTVSADRLTYAFDLRDDVRFQNGAPFTAEDVKYSYEYILDPANRAARRAVWTPIETITTDGPHRVQFKLRHPYRPLLDYMTKYMGIFPAGSRQANPATFFQRAPVGVGTGPGIFVEARTNDYIEFRRNPQYWRRDFPKWDRLVIRIIPEDAARVAALMTGDVQIIGAPPARDFARLRQSAGIAGASRPAIGSSMLIVTNNRQAPFDDPMFRKALSLATDRDTICTQVCHGLVEASATSAPATGWWFNAEADRRSRFNLEAARAALRQSRHAGGVEFDLQYSSQAYLVDTRDVAVFLQARLAQLGIRVNLRPLEAGQLITSALRGNHTASLMAVISPSEPTFLMQAMFKPGEVFVGAIGYENAAFTQLLTDSYTPDDEATLRPILHRMQDILADDSPVVWIGTVHASNLWRTNVSGFAPSVGHTLRLGDVSIG